MGKEEAGSSPFVDGKRGGEARGSGSGRRRGGRGEDEDDGDEAATTDGDERARERGRGGGYLGVARRAAVAYLSTPPPCSDARAMRHGGNGDDQRRGRMQATKRGEISGTTGQSTVLPDRAVVPHIRAVVPLNNFHLHFAFEFQFDSEFEM